MERRDGLFRIITQSIAQCQHAFGDAVLHDGHDSLSGLF